MRLIGFQLIVNIPSFQLVVPAHQYQNESNDEEQKEARDLRALSQQGNNSRGLSEESS